MPVSSPEHLSDAFAAAINARDIPAALDLWIDDAAIIQPDGQMIRGRDAIAGALQALVDNKVTLDIHVANVFAVGDIATAVGTLTMNGTATNGESFAQSGQSIVIYQKGPDGWRVAIDAPWGLPHGQP